jgi:hypothetical protein
LTSRGSKLVGGLLIVVVLAAGAGYWLLTPSIQNETTSIAERSSVLTPLQRSHASAEWTVPGSFTTGSWAATETLWLNVTATEPVSYYLALLESNGTQPYAQLAKELRKLPDLTNATAVSKIVFLGLSATNPEVKEAFQLMMKGGTPSPSDFAYSVPKYNTELEVLYWLACQNQFKKDDTLALSVAMVNGLWVTMGDDKVKEVVKKDVNDLLDFFRDTNKIQMERGYPCLEDYPLEAKISLAWTGAQSPTMAKDHALALFRNTRLDIKSYLSDTVSVETLKEMREVWDGRHWIDRDIDKAMANLEGFFYCGEFGCQNWIYTMDLTKVPSVGGTTTVDGEEVGDYIFGNLDFQFNYFSQTGKGYGVSVDQANLVNTFAKSFGISTVVVWELLSENIYRPMNHPFAVYYKPGWKAWKAWPLQAQESHNARLLNETVDYLVFRPPVSQGGYVPEIKYNIEGPRFDLSIYVQGRPYDVFEKATSVSNMVPILTKGLPTSQMKQWLLYS